MPMTPNEIYGIPPRGIDSWFDSSTSVIERVLEIEPWYLDCDKLKAADQGRLTIHSKLYHYINHNNGVSVDALYFDKQPFAVAYSAGQNHIEPYVTNNILWQEARSYVRAILNNAADVEHELYSENSQLPNNFGSAVFARFGNEIRLVDPSNVHPFTGNPIYDMKAYETVIDTVCRPLYKELGKEGEQGLSNPRMREAGFNAYLAGVMGDMIPLQIELTPTSMLIAVSQNEGQTFAFQINTSGSHLSWGRQITPISIGPASMFECYFDYVHGRPVDIDNQYVRQVADAFGADPAIVQREVTDFIVNGGKSVAERVIQTLPRDERVHGKAQSSHAYPSLAIAYKVLDNPEISRFCNFGSPNLEKARKNIARLNALFEAHPENPAI
jgi:hypothetical protein